MDSGRSLCGPFGCSGGLEIEGSCSVGRSGWLVLHQVPGERHWLPTLSPGEVFPRSGVQPCGGAHGWGASGGAQAQKFGPPPLVTVVHNSVLLEFCFTNIILIMCNINPRWTVAIPSRASPAVLLSGWPCARCHSGCAAVLGKSWPPYQAWLSSGKPNKVLSDVNRE